MAFTQHMLVASFRGLLERGVIAAENYEQALALFFRQASFRKLAPTPESVHAALYHWRELQDAERWPDWRIDGMLLIDETISIDQARPGS